jgi:diketogulonate reductase-like aldo/keto reductase
VRNYLAKGEKTRKDIWITTKVWIDYYDRLKNSVEASLKRLKMEYIDLLLLHRPINIAVHEKCFDEMMKLQDIGKVRHI